MLFNGVKRELATVTAAVEQMDNDDYERVNAYYTICGSEKFPSIQLYEEYICYVSNAHKVTRKDNKWLRDYEWSLNN